MSETPLQTLEATLETYRQAQRRLRFQTDDVHESWALTQLMADALRLSVARGWDVNAMLSRAERLWHCQDMKRQIAQLISEAEALDLNGKPE